MMNAWTKKKPCLVQKWLMHEGDVNEIREIKEIKRWRERKRKRREIFRWEVKGMIGQKVGSREYGVGRVQVEKDVVLGILFVAIHITITRPSHLSDSANDVSSISPVVSQAIGFPPDGYGRN